MTLRDDRGLWLHRLVCLVCTRQQGKALDVGTEILTTAGWSTMGELQVGDEVFHPDGHPARVIGAFDVMHGRRCYEVTTTDGRKIVADADHLWTVQDRRRETYPQGRRERGHFEWETLTTEQLLARGLMRSGREFAYRLPRQHAIVSKPVDLSVDPYVLGAWLGDGSSYKAEITSSDAEVFAAVEAAGYPLTYNYPAGQAQTRGCVGLWGKFRKLKLLGNKHVPADYLAASAEQRLALLQGLLDTDGSITVAGQVEFTSTNRQLSDDVLYLARSLGWRPSLTEGRATLNGRDCGPKYRVRFTPDVGDLMPFRLARKTSRVRTCKSRGGERRCISIRSIVEVESRPVRCIKVDRPDGLFLAGRDLMPTHNTEVVVRRILFGLFVLGETGVYSAQRGQTADAVFARVVDVIKANPELWGAVVEGPTGGKAGRGDVTVRSIDGTIAHLRCGVRSTDLGRGLDQIDLVVFDEAYNLTPAEVAALTGAQMASPNAQTIYTSTAPVASVHMFCDIFAGLRDLGLKGYRNPEERDGDLHYSEYCAPDPPVDEVERAQARTDRELWRLASPSHGVISQDRDIDNNRKVLCINAEGVALWEADYLGWGEWPTTEESREAIIPVEEVWLALVPDQPPELVGQYVLTVSRSQDRRRWYITVGRRTVEGRVFLEVGYAQAANIGEVASYLLGLIEEWDPVEVIVEGHDPGVDIVPVMRKLGIDVRATNANEFAVACAGFIDAAFAGDVEHMGQPLITDCLTEAIMRTMPKGDRVFDTKEGQIAPLIGYVLTHWGVLEFAEEDAPAALPAASGGGGGGYFGTSYGDAPEFGATSAGMDAYGMTY